MHESLLPNLHRLLLDAIADAVIATDVSGSIIYWNRAAQDLYGFTPQEVLGKSVEEITVPSPNAEQAREIMASLQQGRAWHGTFEVVRKDGSQFIADVRNVPVVNDQGELSAIIGVSRDVSSEIEQTRQREELIAALEKANRAKDEFLALISHELRTPLTSILGFAELLTRFEDQITPEILRESLLDIRDGARRMNRTVQDLLALGRFEVQGEVELEPVPLVHTVTSAVRQYRDQSPQRQITLRFEGEIDRVMAKAAYLDHVLENLLSNADKYSPLSEPIEVVCRRDRDTILIDVMDRGPGIEPEQRHRIFEPFVRAPMAEGTFGAGLGLTVCKRLMELQHGAIWVEPREGGGGCFRVALQAEAGRQQQ